MPNEHERVSQLEAAQTRAIVLFDEIVSRGFIEAGQGEKAVSDRIRDLANEKFGKTRYWHKRIVRSGPHTMFPYAENPPDRIIEPDDIVFADFGPIFEEFESDLGRTYVLGDDPVKHKMAADLPAIFSAGKRYFAGRPGITGAELHAEVSRLAHEAGWTLGGWQAGHLVGEFPHEKIDGADLESYVAPGNTTPMRRHDKSGRVCHWILEVHLIDADRGFGGFHEQLLDLA
jgi:Xaa-Pro aminopeptidase